MSIQATYKQSTDQRDYTPSGAKACGEIVTLPDGLAGVVVAQAGLAASEKGSVYTEGIFDVLSASATLFTAGDPVYWDASDDLAITTPGESEDILIGHALADKANGETVVRVELNTMPGITQLTPFAGRYAPTIAYNSTDEHEVLRAEDNPNGCLVFSAFARIVATMAGSSEDQQIVTLYDDDDNALVTLTPSDAGADAAGDLVKGVGCVEGNATGIANAAIAAGKGAYFKVSQACSGSGAAGSMKCYAVFLPVP